MMLHSPIVMLIHSCVEVLLMSEGIFMITTYHYIFFASQAVQARLGINQLPLSETSEIVRKKCPAI